MQHPLLLSTAEDVDHLIDSLLTGPPLHDAAHLLSRARPKTSAGLWDHELYVGVSKHAQVGVLGPVGSRDQGVGWRL
ncbi:Imm1 family immunity protein [Streptomyces sp. NPDC005708]|uniref:Imm1 family immunity protein n=1 Tax=Streptomyces sp. NPDC005708 TaxID=3154564 RepID=UPI003401039F